MAYFHSIPVRALGPGDEAHTPAPYAWAATQKEKGAAVSTEKVPAHLGGFSTQGKKAATFSSDH